MKVSIRKQENIAQVEVVVLCREQTEFVSRLADRIGRISFSVTGRDGEKTERIPIEEIYYFESVENRTYIYCREKVFSCGEKLYELEEKLGGASFLRISKSCILNTEKIRSAKAQVNGRLLVLLENGEKLTVNRSYVSNLKDSIRL